MFKGFSNCLTIPPELNGVSNHSNMTYEEHAGVLKKVEVCNDKFNPVVLYSKHMFLIVI